MAPTRIPGHVIDEFEDAMTRLGRLIASQHAGPDCCPESLTLSQMMLMRALESSDSLNMTDVAALLAVKPPAASSVVDGLARHGYVERASAESDRRVTLVHLTDEGRAVLLEAEKTRHELMRNYLELLGEEDVRTMTRINHTLIHAIESGLV